MTPNHLCIDPGASGGLAWRDNEGTLFVIPMPYGMTGIVSLIQELKAKMPNLYATVERVGGYMPGNSGPAACKFARHCGHIEAALYAYAVSFRMVAPQVWMRALGALPKDKGERKRAIKEVVARLYPTVSVTLKTADALGILAWAEAIKDKAARLVRTCDGAANTPVDRRAASDPTGGSEGGAS